jgi:hypothetical protein
MVKRCVSILVAAVTVTSATSALAYDPQFAQYYVGRDLRATIPTGTYAGLPNPNFNRLTLLFAHTYLSTPEINHYHAKSPYTYFGPNLGASTAVQPFNGNAAGLPSGNYLPEGGTLGNSPRLQLLPGSGVFTGKFISGLAGSLTPADEDFGKLELRSVDALAGGPAGSPAAVLFNSGGSTPVGRWTGSIAGSNLSLVLVSITPGLSVADLSGNTVLSQPGDSVLIGTGGTDMSFTPVLQSSLTGRVNLSATFKIVDSGTGNGGSPWLESGQYVINAVIPEPAALGLLVPLGLLLTRQRR